MNGLTRVINRAGRGYSFDAIRAKVLYGGKQRKTDTEYVNVSLAMKIKRLKAERFDLDEEVKRRGVTPRKRKGAKRKRG